jgi:hypothetical protein
MTDKRLKRSIERFTFGYEPEEDRFFFRGQLKEHEGIVKLWLTARLTNNFLKVLEKKGFFEDSFIEEVKSKTMRKKASARRQEKEQVQQEPVELALKYWADELVRQLDLTFNAKGVTFVFRQSKETYVLNLSHESLQEWLEALYGLCAAANWCLDVWPIPFQGARSSLRKKNLN